MRGPQFDFPLKHISNMPELLAASGTVHRALLMIACAYWQSGRHMPIADDTTLAAICKLSTQHFRVVSPHVRALWERLRPLLEEDYREKDRVHKTKSAQTERMRARMREKRVSEQVFNRTAKRALPLPLPTLEARIPSELKNGQRLPQLRQRRGRVAPLVARGLSIDGVLTLPRGCNTYLCADCFPSALAHNLLIDNA
jgi:uncharacterized protein YdaU (DUF1376 family)